MADVHVTALDGLARGVRVKGEIDISTADSVEQAIAALPDGPGPVVIEGSEIDFIDSAGLRLLLSLVNGAGQTPAVVIRNPSRAVARLFEIALPAGVPGLAVEVDEDGRAPFDVRSRSGESSSAV